MIRYEKHTVMGIHHPMKIIQDEKSRKPETEPPEGIGYP
jgi:hypothetical protein